MPFDKWFTERVGELRAESLCPYLVFYEAWHCRPLSLGLQLYLEIYRLSAPARMHNRTREQLTARGELDYP